MQRSSMKSLAALVFAGALMGGAMPAQANVGLTNTQESRKDIVIPKEAAVVPVGVRNKFGGFSGEPNPYKHHMKGYRNQRQLRKLWRQAPNTRPKKNRK